MKNSQDTNTLTELVVHYDLAHFLSSSKHGYVRELTKDDHGRYDIEGDGYGFFSSDGNLKTMLDNKDGLTQHVLNADWIIHTLH